LRALARNGQLGVTVVDQAAAQQARLGMEILAAEGALDGDVGGDAVGWGQIR